MRLWIPMASLPDGFADLREPVSVLPPWLWLIPLGITCVALLLGWLFLKKSKDSIHSTQAAPTVPPHTIALNRLRDLRNQLDALSSGIFAVRVTGAVRTYIEDALQLPANEQTSEEFLRSAEEDSRIPAAVKEPLPQFLQQMDLAKFARQELNSQGRKQFLDSAESAVRAIHEELEKQTPRERISPTPASTAAVAP